MAIILDIFGVAYTGQINTDLFKITDHFREKGHKIYLASNVEEAKINIFMNDFGLKRHVDNMFCSGKIGVAKPSSAFYHHITQHIAETPDNIIFFDDSIVNIEAARAYGWHAYPYDGVKDVNKKIEEFLLLKE